MNQKILTVHCTDAIPSALANDIITTKEELMMDLEQRKTGILKSIEASTKHTTKYYKVLESLLDDFLSAVDKTILPRRLEDWWRYAYEITPAGAVLYIEHVAEVSLREPEMEWNSDRSDQVFVLLEIRGKWLSVDEYAKQYEVEPVTVRQWIRRGKLRSAIKIGKEWVIPAVSDVPSRGYEPGQYRWRPPIADLPEEYSYLNDYVQISIAQDPKDKKSFFAMLTNGSLENLQTKRLTLSVEEREQLEMTLIANPKIRFVSDRFSFSFKKKNTFADETEAE